MLQHLSSRFLPTLCAYVSSGLVHNYSHCQKFTICLRTYACTYTGTQLVWEDHLGLPSLRFCGKNFKYFRNHGLPRRSCCVIGCWRLSLNGIGIAQECLFSIMTIKSLLPESIRKLLRLPGRGEFFHTETHFFVSCVVFRCFDLICTEKSEDLRVNVEERSEELGGRRQTKTNPQFPFFWISSLDDPHCQFIRLPNYSRSKHLVSVAK